jgi:hypothetical protein
MAMSKKTKNSKNRSIPAKKRTMEGFRENKMGNIDRELGEDLTTKESEADQKKLSPREEL